MAIHLPITCLIPLLPHRVTHHQLRGATAMERVPHTTLSLMPDHHRATLVTPLATLKVILKDTLTNRNINSSMVGSLNLLKDTAVRVMEAPLSRSMLHIKATATAMDTSTNHQTGIRSMTAIKRCISSLG
jgi:hypothetical protein